ncbi:amidohydrolase family protein [Chloroflexota bacterium]
MIIDAHQHIFESKWVPTAVPKILARRLAKARLPYRDPEEILLSIEALWYDPGGERWARDMEELGIDIGVSLPNDFELFEGAAEDPGYSIEKIHEEYYSLTKKYSGKFFTFVGVDPRRSNALQIIERGVRERGAKGVKLLPPVGFYPNDRICYRIYEKCANLGIPVCIHTGPTTLGWNKYSNPLCVEEPLKDFPEIEFILAHGGGGLGFMWEEALSVAFANANANLDFATVAPSVIKGGWMGPNGKYKDHIPQFLDVLDIMRNHLAGGCLNLLFATDYPVVGSMDTLKEWIQLFKNLPSVAGQYGYKFSEKEAEQILWQNANRIMKLGIAEA